MPAAERGRQWHDDAAAAAAALPGSLAGNQRWLAASRILHSARPCHCYWATMTSRCSRLNRRFRHGRATRETACDDRECQRSVQGHRSHAGTELVTYGTCVRYDPHGKVRSYRFRCVQCYKIQDNAVPHDCETFRIGYLLWCPKERFVYSNLFADIKEQWNMT